MYILYVFVKKNYEISIRFNRTPYTVGECTYMYLYYLQCNVFPSAIIILRRGSTFFYLECAVLFFNLFG